MIDTNTTDPGMDRKGARDFFYSYFYAMYLQNQSSVQEALEEYLSSETDRNGALLLAEVEELLNSGMTEDELKNLIEKTWQADVDSQLFDFTYKDILGQIVKFMHEQKHDKN